MQRWIQICISRSKAAHSVGWGFPVFLIDRSLRICHVWAPFNAFAGAAPPLGAIALPRRGAAEDHADDTSDHTEWPRHQLSLASWEGFHGRHSLCPLWEIWIMYITRLCSLAILTGSGGLEQDHVSGFWSYPLMTSMIDWRQKTFWGFQVSCIVVIITLVMLPV